MFYVTLILVVLQPHGSSTFNLRDWFTNEVESAKNAVIKVKNWVKNLRLWSSRDWDCGTERMWSTKLISKAVAEKECPNVLDQINRACRWHDSCYEHRLVVQNMCDMMFCENLFNISFPSKEEKQACFLTQAMCDAVKLGGAFFYSDKTK
ncbi:hypothetical protein Y032_0045g1270 [Ancylostoma ceylanicum]|uniref:Uncharacterized protein n=1 Tax=Ancylostoma ceylanicum TaxID=53326 RepID=A0A016UE36_9BILA|nr:hypothetical protein Y032_0045g1270 [Ancylostoma ceylanicum]